VDFVEISKYKWRLGGKYARNNNLGQMHRFILEKMLSSKIPKNMEVDHINHNKLDNRRENLRLCSKSENQANSIRKVGRLGYKGVISHRRKFEARIQKDGKKIYIGLYDTPQEAESAYKLKSVELFGDFALK
jgi:hypothetical protein